MNDSQVPSRPQELTNGTLYRLLQPKYPLQAISRVEWKPMGAGVLSEVVIITAEGSTRENVPWREEFVAKFRRPEFPFEGMFNVESTLYLLLDQDRDLNDRMPFALPPIVFTSDRLIILERVKDVTSTPAVEGCPASSIPPIIKKLAQMHARFAGLDCTSLAANAGIGSDLTGDTKRDKFPSTYKPFLDDLDLEQADRSRMNSLCEALSSKPEILKQVHDALLSSPSTLIHGDFHIANMLFPNEENDRTWLLDWAASGRGNPMRDVAFFFIVSTTTEDRRAQEKNYLKLYMSTVKDEDGSLACSEQEWWYQYRLAVLNQFAILVVYDQLSKQLANNAPTEELRTALHHHFKVVSTRACQCLLDQFPTVDSVLSWLN